MTTETMTERAVNFSAGPAVLPLPVLQQIREEILCLPGVGSSILEISHRSPAFGEIIAKTETGFRNLLNVPADYEIVFVQGGANLQNVMIPQNFLSDENQTADYIITGAWGKKSADEVKRFGKLNVAFDAAEQKYNHIPSNDQLQLTDDAAYVHITSNETIHGVQFQSLPEVGNRPLVCDHSSDILSRPIDISQYGMLYACAQKNCGVAGVTVCVIRKDLLERCTDRLPKYLNFQKHVDGNSMMNTPPTFAIYVTGLVCDWLRDEIGGLEKMHKINRDKSKMLYDTVDQSGGFYTGHAAEKDRSEMNVVFKLGSAGLDKKFLASAADQGMTTLAGHRSLGGVRASIYNAMPVEGVKQLADFMRDFQLKNG